MASRLSGASILLAVLLLLLVACAGEGAGTSPAIGGQGGSDEAGSGGGGGTGGDNQPECMRDYQEPSLPHTACPSTLPSYIGEFSWFYSAMCLPESAGSGDKPAQYWLTGDEAPCFTLYFGLGGEYPGQNPLQARVSMFVDGRQVVFSMDGEPPAFIHTADLDPAGLNDLSVAVCLDAQTPGEGLHLLTPVITFPGDKWAAVEAKRLMAVRNSTCLVEPRPVVKSSRIVQREGLGYTWIEDAEFDFILVGGGVRGIAEDGRLPIRLHVYGDYLGDEYQTDSIIVAMVDEQEIPLGDLGFAPRVASPESPGDAAVFEVVLENLPLGNQRHRLTFLQLWGYGKPAMDAAGHSLQPIPHYTTHVTSFEYEAGAW